MKRYLALTLLGNTVILLLTTALWSVMADSRINTGVMSNQTLRPKRSGQRGLALPASISHRGQDRGEWGRDPEYFYTSRAIRGSCVIGKMRERRLKSRPLGVVVKQNALSFLPFSINLELHHSNTSLRVLVPSSSSAIWPPTVHRHLVVNLMKKPAM